KIATYGPTLGLAAGDITDLTNLCGGTIEYIEGAEIKKNEAQNAITTKETFKKEQLPVLRNAIERLKTHSDYTEAIGQELGVIGSESAVPDKPGLKAKARVNDVELSFTKKGLEGVNIYARLKGAAQWTFLARDTHSPYNDSRPLTNAGVPETREYMCIGVIADEETGEPSDIVSAIFGG
ncbi:MAG TPA: hypothetical protein VET23_08295, partial [Chitinophagaceae bacterium]|nr:hypothetical protein [Chitinophagaceae bacterium]